MPVQENPVLLPLSPAWKQRLRDFAQGKIQSITETQHSPQEQTLSESTGEFKPKGTLQNNGEFGGKQVGATR